MIAGRVDLDLTPVDGLRRSGIRKALRIGVNRAAAPVKASVVSHAEAVRRYGFLAKSIRIRLRTYPGERYVAVIGPSSKYVRTKGKYTRGKHKGEKRVSRPSKYAHLVERGTKRSRARPWLKPAHDETAARYLDRVGQEVGLEIARELSRAAKTK